MIGGGDGYFNFCHFFEYGDYGWLLFMVEYYGDTFMIFSWILLWLRSFFKAIGKWGQFCYPTMDSCLESNQNLLSIT